MKNNCYLIGEKKVVNGNAIFSPGQSEEGFVFKDERAFKEHKGVCYIAECEFDSDTIELNIDNIYDKINEGGVSTYTSICKEIDRLCFDHDVPREKEFIDYIAEYVFDMVDWQCASTYLMELDIEEEYDLWKNK